MNNMWKVLILTVLVLSPYSTHGKISPKVKANIEKGLAAGKSLADALAKGNFKNSMVKLAKDLSPFLGVLGPLTSLVLVFVPTGDSAELKYMKNQFKIVNNKLDKITREFQNVKNAITWNGVVVSYGRYERKIRNAEENLNRIFTVTGKKNREHERKNFIRNYENDFSNSLQKLYDVIVKKDHVFSKNILETVTIQMNYHKRKIEKFSLGLVQLLIQGIKVSLF